MTTDEKNLNRILKSLVPDGISYGYKVFDATLSGDKLAEFRANFPLSENELQDIQRAIPKREIEYRTGRFLVKNLLGIDQFNTQTQLYKKPNGCPNWPEDVIGSISHSGSICIAALSNTARFSGIGIDLELGDFEPDLERFIAQPDELSRFPERLSYSATLRAIFCSKEAIYKSLEKYLTEKIDFKDVVIQVSKLYDSSVFEFNPLFTRSIPSLELFEHEQFYGRVYADEKLALSMAAIKPRA